jgi:glycerate dehydrogenase
MPHQIAVTYLPSERQKEAIHAILDEIAEIKYLPELADSKRMSALETAEAILANNWSATEISTRETRCLKKVRMIQLMFAGADKVPFESIPAGITLASNVGAFAEPLAEHVLAMTLCLAKSILPRHLELANGTFDPSGYNKELKAGICGIIGMGGNGAAIARLMQAMGMQVYGINRSGTSPLPLNFVGNLDDLDTLLAKSDVLVLTVPLNKETFNLIGKRELQLMKPDAILINVARGRVIDQQALYQHLKSTPTFGAGIDTWWSEPGSPEGFKLDYPFFDLPNLVGSPHNADDVPGAMTAASQMAAENIRRFLEGKKIQGEINRLDYIS